jgi:hypothetical protein
LPTQKTGFTTPTTLNTAGSNANTTSEFAAIVQSAPYTASGGALTSLTLKAADPNATMTVSYDGTSKPNSLTIQSVNLSGVVKYNQTVTSLTGQTTPASTSAVQLDDAATAGSTPQNVAGVLMSYKPSGGASTTFKYQTFGPWAYDNGSTGGNLSWFSYGIPFSATMPTTGTATYAGIAVGYYIDTSGTMYATTADMSATADFGASTMSFSTSNTNTIDVNSGATAANAALDLTSSTTSPLTIKGNNFTGTVANAAGTISGNATGLFYGSSTGLTTGSAGGAAVGTPEEIGGTYAATGTGGAMLGAFGGKVQ